MTKLPIPAAALDQHTIALGKTRAGKSSKLRLIVEHLLAKDQPVGIIDPKGDWWGIRASADGKKSGFPVVIFGGEHADVPINERSGAEVAELVAAENRPYLIDLGGWTVGARTRFFIDFTRTLFRLTRGKRWLVIDECHNFAPQGRTFDVEQAKALHWANRLASEGQGKGLVLLSASQRPQKVNKDYVTSHETLIACRVIHPLDRGAIKEWVDGCADPAIGKAMMTDLAQMPRTDAYVWSPEIGFGPERIKFPMFATFDSFKPAEEGAALKPKGWAGVDLVAVTAKLSKVVEEAKANDPAELKKALAATQVLLKEALATPPASLSAPTPVKAKNYVADQKALDAAHGAGFMAGFLAGWEQGWPAGHRKGCEAQVKEFGQVALAFTPVAPPPKMPKVPQGTLASRLVITPKASIPQTPRPTPERIDARAAAMSIRNPGAALPKAEKAILRVLVHFPDGADASKVATLAGYSAGGGGFRNACGALRTAGLLEPGQPLRATQAGVEAAGDVEPLPTGAELLAYWCGHSALGKAEREILTALFNALPGGLTKEEVAQLAGYEPGGGGFRNALGRLRTLDLITGSGQQDLRAAEGFA